MKDRNAKFFVYFAKVPDGLIKIGTSSNVAKRVANLKGSLIHFIEGASFRETAVHFLLRGSHARGECFHDTDEVRGFIRGLQAGDFGGLIEDVPDVHRPDVYHNCGPLKGRERCFKIAREALGLSFEDVALGAGIAVSTARFADSATAPTLLSGRVVQYIVGKAAERGVWLNSHHFTGLYDRDLRRQLSVLDDMEDAA